MIKVIKFLEKMWLMLAIVTFIIAIYRTFTNDIYDALYFYAFSVVAALLFIMRRKQRKYHERNSR